jgi:hypothetical protein
LGEKRAAIADTFSGWDGFNMGDLGPDRHYRLKLWPIYAAGQDIIAQPVKYSTQTYQIAALRPFNNGTRRIRKINNFRIVPRFADRRYRFMKSCDL